MKVFIKQPKDLLDYDIDMSNWLSSDDRIQEVEIEAPEGIEVVSYGYTDTHVKLWIRGGTAGESYKLSPVIFTNTREKEVDIVIVVEDF